METAPYIPTSETSRAAAQAIEPSLGRLQREVLAYLRYCRDAGCTDEELQLSLVLNPSTERPRRIELVEKGLVVDSGVRRKTRSGRLATVWRVRTR